LLKFPKKQREDAVRIKVINGVLARQKNKDGSDAGFAPLAAGTYEVIGPEQNGCLEVRKDDGINVFLPIEKLDTYVKRGDVQIT
jgi:hypothetical protein